MNQEEICDLLATLSDEENEVIDDGSGEFSEHDTISEMSECDDQIDFQHDDESMDMEEHVQTFKGNFLFFESLTICYTFLILLFAQ